MNLNQAKAVADIAPQRSIAGREDLQRAIRHCVKSIVTARRNGNDLRAAELSEAKEVFRRRLHRNNCAVCGAAIGRGATHCRLHQAGRTPKALPAAGWQPEAPSAKRNANARVDVSPKGGLIARFGFYLPIVSKVFKKWQPAIGDGPARNCFMTAAGGILNKQQISLGTTPRAQWPCVLEFGAALTAAVCERTSPESWLLNHIHLLIVGDWTTGFQSWQKLSEQTGRGGWPQFNAGRIAKAAGRLQLLTPDKVAKSFRRAVKTKTG